MNNCINKIQIDDLNKIIKEIRYFFKKYGFIELSTYEYNLLDTIVIPKSIITYNDTGSISSLKQTNIFTLEKYLLEDDTTIGFFSLNYFIKSKSNNKSYPIFEFVMRNNMKTNFHFVKNFNFAGLLKSPSFAHSCIGIISEFQQRFVQKFVRFVQGKSWSKLKR